MTERDWTASGFACPDCNEQEKLTYRIKPDEYVCGACGLVSTVNEVVAHSLERGFSNESTKGEVSEYIEKRLSDYATAVGGSSSDPTDRGQ